MAEGMGLLNDSLAAVAATERENSDWTFTDEDGNRWGVSPRTIHLGSQALSLQYCSGPTCPDLFVPPPGRREEFDNRVRGFNEIRVQAARAAIEDVLRQRAAAIRLRRDTTTGGTL